MSVEAEAEAILSFSAGCKVIIRLVPVYSVAAFPPPPPPCPSCGGSWTNYNKTEHHNFSHPSLYQVLLAWGLNFPQKSLAVTINGAPECELGMSLLCPGPIACI